MDGSRGCPLLPMLRIHRSLTNSPSPLPRQASRFELRCLGGAELLSATDADLRSVVPAAQYPRLLRLLRAHEAFDELDSAGERARMLDPPTTCAVPFAAAAAPPSLLPAGPARLCLCACPAHL
jgi:hypothetical protein